MSIGDLPNPNQQAYDAMMLSASSFLASEQSFSMQGVSRQPSDCDILAALITAAQRVYNQNCPIL
jgi:hypothetical protein